MRGRQYERGISSAGDRVNDRAVTEPTPSKTGIDSPGVTRVARVILLACVLVAGAVLFNMLGGQRIIGQVVPSSCVVGLTGAAVSIQLDGPTAAAACDRFAATTATDGGTWYVYRNGVTPGGSVICQVDWRDGNTYTVRDSGALTLYGSGICKNLLSPADVGSEPEAEPAGGIPIGPCVLGVEGHDVTIDVSNGGCEQFVGEIPAPFGGTYVVLETAPSIPIVCEVFAQGHYNAIVRDSGGQRYAGAICESLRGLPGAYG